MVNPSLLLSRNGPRPDRLHLARDRHDGGRRLWPRAVLVILIGAKETGGRSRPVGLNGAGARQAAAPASPPYSTSTPKAVAPAQQKPGARPGSCVKGLARRCASRRGVSSRRSELGLHIDKDACRVLPLRIEATDVVQFDTSRCGSDKKPASGRLGTRGIA